MLMLLEIFQKFTQTVIRRDYSFEYHYFFLAMSAGNIVGHHVDIEVIKQFQKLDPRYSAEKFQKLENRFITPRQHDNANANDDHIGRTKPPKTIRKVETKTFLE